MGMPWWSPQFHPLAALLSLPPFNSNTCLWGEIISEYNFFKYAFSICSPGRPENEPDRWAKPWFGWRIWPHFHFSFVSDKCFFLLFSMLLAESPIGWLHFFSVSFLFVWTVVCLRLILFNIFWLFYVFFFRLLPCSFILGFGFMGAAGRALPYFCNNNHRVEHRDWEGRGPGDRGIERLPWLENNLSIEQFVQMFIFILLPSRPITKCQKLFKLMWNFLFALEFFLINVEKKYAETFFVLHETNDYCVLLRLSGVI